MYEHKKNYNTFSINCVVQETIDFLRNIIRPCNQVGLHKFCEDF